MDSKELKCILREKLSVIASTYVADAKVHFTSGSVSVARTYLYKKWLDEFGYILAIVLLIRISWTWIELLFI